MRRQHSRQPPYCDSWSKRANGDEAIMTLRMTSSLTFCFNLFLQIDQDFTFWPRLTSKDETILDVGVAQAVRIILLDDALKKNNLAGPALARSAGKSDRNICGDRKIEQVVRALAIHLDLACSERYLGNKCWHQPVRHS